MCNINECKQKDVKLVSFVSYRIHGYNTLYFTSFC